MFNLNFDHEDAMQEQRILKKLNEDFALVKHLVEEKRKVSRSIVVGKIICFMRKRHQSGNNIPVGLHEILSGTDQQFVNWDIRYWLYTTAIPDHPNILSIYGGLKFLYRPKYIINNRSDLLSLLKKTYDENEGGIPLDEVLESLPNALEIIQENSNDIVTLTRLMDKKKVLFHSKKAEDLEQMDKDILISSMYAVPRKYRVAAGSSACSLYGAPMNVESDSDAQSGSGGSGRNLLFGNYETGSDSSDWKAFGGSTDSPENDGSNALDGASGTAGSSKGEENAGTTLVCEPDVLSNDGDENGDVPM